MKNLSPILLFLLTVTPSLYQESHAETPNAGNNPNQLIQSIFAQNQGKLLCLPEDLLPNEVQTQVSYYLGFHKATAITVQALIDTLLKLYPCPFSPYRAELRPAKSMNLIGDWIYPKKSQGLRFTESSGRRGIPPNVNFVCDAFSYFHNGEMRHAMIVGKTECPFATMSDIDALRKTPSIEHWIMHRDGHIKITRLDIKNYFEEWDFYVVIQPFSFHEFRFKPNDLLGYLRKTPSHHNGGSTEFIHLTPVRR